jgi:hypothetical protein
VTAPVVVLVFALGLDKNVLVTFILGIFTAGSGAYFLSVVAGNLGRSLQDKLWRSWGGAPTAHLLRVHSNESNLSQRRIWRTAVENVTGVEFLSEAEEVADLTRADEVITAAIGQVRHLTHDSRYPLVAKENAQYGFERNLYGARWLGRVLATLCLAALLIVRIVFHINAVTLFIGLVVEVGVSVLWFTIPSRSRIKKAAFRYGEQLLQAVALESRGKTS